MQMFSVVFFGLVAVTFVALYFVNRLVKNDKAIFVSKLIILVLSYVFVIYADYRFAVVLMLLTVVTWICTKKEKLIPFGIIVSLLSLGFFKYTNFFIESFSKIFNAETTPLNIILPIGISFYTFSAISYLVDVKRGKVATGSFIDVATYLSFFPKLTSGPIQRSKDFFDQLNERRNIGIDSFLAGIQIFVFGLFKKYVLADHLSIFVNQVYATPNVFDSLTVFIAVIAYSLQIYLDFSGYSDMAIGVAKILGFDLPRNFNLPYLSHNVQELWKRWHISLSSWLMEYLYFPLGGSRKGKIRTYINLILTMVIGGIWHGANWTYVFWGFLHGIALAFHKLWMKLTKSNLKKHSIFSNIVSIVITFLFTTFCWIFFRADSIQQAFEIILRIFAFDSGLEQPYFWFFISLAFVIGYAVFCLVKSKKQGLQPKKMNYSYVQDEYLVKDLSKFWNLVFFFVLLGAVLCFAYTGGSPFIYGNY